MEKIAQGAEAVLFEDNGMVIKDRIKKKYRLKKIDDKLRGFRTRREAKVLRKLEEIKFPAPRLIECDEKEKIIMENVKGAKLRDVFEKRNYLKLSREIGKKIAVLHKNNIVHGDLTTSNMILGKEIYFIDAAKSKISGISKKEEIFFIDFGLSFFSEKIEDKAVDLHLLKQALESKHYKVWEKCFKVALKGYGDRKVIERLETVELRGRYKQKS